MNIMQIRQMFYLGLSPKLHMHLKQYQNSIYKPFKDFLQQDLEALMVHYPNEIHTKQQNVTW
jgi:hypothetical protein